ncbi:MULTISPECIES: hypothetical protein [Aeromonas]|uniref:hypothetical protein n=1 Tax=Aeromonas TaxID=642 RepID=UPI0003917742|nr:MULTISPECIES: hypothetical protein [Aeromonas]MBL0523209.1 hypothetical protein [Aeromonas enteropelogenes]QMS78824.1 hypothetical protein M001_021845 [Aeromonas veronii Hm21]
MSISSPSLIKVTAWLFISLQGVLVWQGNRMVNSIDKLTIAAADNQAIMASQEVRLKEVEKDQMELSRNTGAAVLNLTSETRDLDRRITKLESTQ